jgi:hypothetical protein
MWKVDCSQDGHRILLLGKMPAGVQQSKAELSQKKKTKRFAATGKTWEKRRGNALQVILSCRGRRK